MGIKQIQDGRSMIEVKRAVTISFDDTKRKCSLKVKQALYFFTCIYIAEKKCFITFNMLSAIFTFQSWVFLREGCGGACNTEGTCIEQR